MRVIILPEAEGDIDETAAFYEEQEPGLGTEVYRFRRGEIDTLSTTAGIHRKRGRFRAMVVLGRFPYFIVMYRKSEQAAEVCAVIDARRDLEWNAQWNAQLLAGR